jgi:hypothetical protein
VLEQCDPAEIRLIILHELAHLKRRDVAGNWLITLATLLHWFNPFVWLLAARMRADRELACDEMVLANSDGREARAYGQTLLKLVEILAPAPAAPGQLVGILEGSSSMQRRVLMIAKFDPRHSSRWMWALAILLLLAVTALTDAVSESASAAAPATAPAQAEAVTDQAVRAMLEKRLPEVQFDGNSFNDVIEFLRDVTQTNLLVDWPVLKAAGIDKEETKISLHLRNVTFGKALELILHEAGGKKALLAYMIKNGGIVITTREKILQDNPPLMTDEALQQLLNKPLPEIKFDDNPFNDVIEFLRDVTQANLLVDWKVLNDFGIDKETKISLQQLRGVTLGQALDHILRGVGGNAVSLGYMIKSGAIVITTQEKIAQERTPDQSQRSPGPARRTVYYDVRDLIESGDAQANLKELVSVVSSTPILTDRGTEASIGDGATYNVQGFGTKLIITTTEEGHKHVADLLAHLREKPTTRPR